MFGKSHRKGWITKGDGCHVIKQDDDNKPGAGTSIDQLVSTQAGLVPQTSNSCLESGGDIITHKTHMARLDDPSIASIPTNPHHFQEQMQYLSKEDYERLERPTKPTALQQNVLTWHERLNHLSFPEMFQLVKFGIPPNKFLAL